MWKKEQKTSAGDWSDTGTFVRKPATGWLHKDSDLTNGAYVRYRLNYLGCAVVQESMRSLQYQLRTMVTREAISRLAEQSDRIPVKKRKVPSKVSKILGGAITRLSGDINLCIDVDQLAVYSHANGQEMVTHSLTTISFASGGDGITQDFVGYVAKDRINDRACHVFHCPGGTAQLVLATVGQAFELRYKMYLGSSSGAPQQQHHQHSPQVVSPSFNSHSAATPTSTHSYHQPVPHETRHVTPEARHVMSDNRHVTPDNRHVTPDPRHVPPPCHELRHNRPTESFNDNRYASTSDPPSYSSTTSSVSDPLPPPLPIANFGSQNKRPPKHLPSDPPPLTEVIRQVQAPLPPPPSIPPQSLVRPRVYSSLPGFPEPESPGLSQQMSIESQYELDEGIQPSTNTTSGSQKGASSGSQKGMTSSNSRPMSYNPYDTMPENYTLSNKDNNHLGSSVDEEQDDKEHDYDVVPEEGDEEEEEEEVTYDIVEGYEDNEGRQIQRPIHDDNHPDHQMELMQPPQEEEYQLITIHQKPSGKVEDQIDLTPSQTPEAINHVYSNLQEELAMSPRTTQPLPEADYDDPESLEIVQNRLQIIQPTNAGEYDDPDAFIQAASLGLDSPDCPPPPYSGLSVNNAGKLPLTKQPSPAFDDSIYSTPQTDIVEPQTDPYAPIHLQSYFHGQISRARAESLVKEDGDFLVRESSNKPGQYVLTGLSNGRSQHLLLIDKSGKVKSKDREFESVPHLVKFFYDRATSLTIGNCEVFLSRPIII